MSSPPPLIQRLADWSENEAAQLSRRGVHLSYRQDGSDGSWAGWIEGESAQRIGTLTLWESGELDMQVLRRADGLLVINEHRLVSDRSELLDALAALELVLAYHDSRE